jgi:hypothetical protein
LRANHDQIRTPGLPAEEFDNAANLSECVYQISQFGFWNTANQGLQKMLRPRQFLQIDIQRLERLQFVEQYRLMPLLSLELLAPGSTLVGDQQQFSQPGIDFAQLRQRRWLGRIGGGFRQALKYAAKRASLARAWAVTS